MTPLFLAVIWLVLAVAFFVVGTDPACYAAAIVCTNVWLAKGWSRA